MLNVKSMLFDNCTCAEASIGSIDSTVSMAADVIRRSIASKVFKVYKAYIGSIDFIVSLSLFFLLAIIYIYRART